MFLSVATGGTTGTITSVPVTVSVLAPGLPATATGAHAPVIDGHVDGPEALTNEVEALN